MTDPKIIADGMTCFSISWIDSMIVCVYDVETLLVRMIPLVTISLVRIEIYDQKSIDAIPVSHVLRHKCYVWIDAEAASV